MINIRFHLNFDEITAARCVSNPPGGYSLGRCRCDSLVGYICLDWHAALAGIATQSQLQVIGSSLLMSIYRFCSEAAALLPPWCLYAVTEFFLDHKMVYHQQNTKKENHQRDNNTSPRCPLSVMQV